MTNFNLNAEDAEDSQRAQKDSIEFSLGPFCDFCGPFAPSAFKNSFRP